MERNSFWTNPDIGVLVLRLTLAFTLFLNGWGKVLHGIEFQMGMLAANGIPGFFMYFVYVSEVLAPVLLALGLFTRLSALTVAATMVTVMYVLPVPFFGLNQFGGWSMELQLLYLAVGWRCSSPAPDGTGSTTQAGGTGCSTEPPPRALVQPSGPEVRAIALVDGINFRTLYLNPQQLDEIPAQDGNLLLVAQRR